MAVSYVWCPFQLKAATSSLMTDNTNGVESISACEKLSNSRPCNMPTSLY